MPQDIVWWKVYDEDREYRRRGRSGAYRLRDLGPRDEHRYRFSYRRLYESPHYRRPRHYEYRPGLTRDDRYINGYSDWYSADRFRSSLRVQTRGDR